MMSTLPMTSIDGDDNSHVSLARILVHKKLQEKMRVAGLTLHDNRFASDFLFNRKIEEMIFTLWHAKAMAKILYSNPLVDFTDSFNYEYLFSEQWGDDEVNGDDSFKDSINSMMMELYGDITSPPSSMSYNQPQQMPYGGPPQQPFGGGGIMFGGGLQQQPPSSMLGGDGIYGGTPMTVPSQPPKPKQQQQQFTLDQLFCGRMIRGKKVAAVFHNGRKYAVDFEDLREMTDYYGGTGLITPSSILKKDQDEDSVPLRQSQRVRFEGGGGGDSGGGFADQDEDSVPLRQSQRVRFEGGGGGGGGGGDGGCGFADQDEDSVPLRQSQRVRFEGGGDGGGGCAAAYQQGYDPTLVGKRTGVMVPPREQVTFNSPSSGKDVLFENPDAFFAAARSGGKMAGGSDNDGDNNGRRMSPRGKKGGRQGIDMDKNERQRNEMEEFEEEARRNAARRPDVLESDEKEEDEQEDGKPRSKASSMMKLGPYSKEDDATLKELASNSADWENIGHTLRRKPNSCERRYFQLLSISLANIRLLRLPKSLRAMVDKENTSSDFAQGSRNNTVYHISPVGPGHLLRWNTDELMPDLRAYCESINYVLSSDELSHLTKCNGKPVLLSDRTIRHAADMGLYNYDKKECNSECKLPHIRHPHTHKFRNVNHNHIYVITNLERGIIKHRYGGDRCQFFGSGKEFDARAYIYCVGNETVQNNNFQSIGISFGATDNHQYMGKTLLPVPFDACYEIEFNGPNLASARVSKIAINDNDNVDDDVEDEAPLPSKVDWNISLSNVIEKNSSGKVMCCVVGCNKHDKRIKNHSTVWMCQKHRNLDLFNNSAVNENNVKINPLWQCKIEGCDKCHQYGCNGYCCLHFTQSGEDKKVAVMRKNRRCKIKECAKYNQSGCNGYCKSHFIEFGEDSDDDDVKKVAVMRKNRRCKIEECAKYNQSGCNGYCKSHFIEFGEDSDDDDSPDGDDDDMSSDEKKVKKVAVKKVPVPPQASVPRQISEYECLRQERIARNNARLAELGLLGDKPKEVKKKVTRKRKSSTVNAPQRQLPDRKSKM